VCCVLFERCAILCICVLCLIVVSLPPVKNAFAIQLNNNKNNYYLQTKASIHNSLILSCWRGGGGGQARLLGSGERNVNASVRLADR
jgi:hypothetical protein